jgi:hypothetical protein
LVNIRPDLVEAIIQESAEEFDSDPLDVEIGQALLESQYILADDIAELREDTATVIDEFLEGLSIIQQDLGIMLESAQYDDDDESYLTEGVQYENDYQNNAEYYVESDPEVYEHLEGLMEGQQALASENERLRESVSLLTSQTLVEHKLFESGLPYHSQERIRPALYGITSEEMDAIIEGEREYLGEIIEESGGVPIVGAGGEVSDEEFISGMRDAAQSRLDRIIGIEE